MKSLSARRFNAGSYRFRPERKAYPDLIAQIRASMGLTPRQMACIFGVPHITIQFWESGRRVPTSAARRLIWLVHRLHFAPKSLRRADTWLRWL